MKSILIGKMVKTHGIKGQIKVYPYTDDLVSLSKEKQVFLDENLQKKLDVEYVKMQSTMLIFKFKNIDIVEDAQNYINKDIYIPKKDISDLEDIYYIEDLIGLLVYDVESNQNIGKISDVFNTGANDVYEVILNDGKKAYLPAIKQVIKKVDIKENKIYVEIMKGLI